MAYSELIKNFERIRDYMREFYVYGFKSRDEFTKKSARCCFSKRMRKVFRKNEKSMLQNCNKKAKRKGRLQRVKKPM